MRFSTQVIAAFALALASFTAAAPVAHDVRSEAATNAAKVVNARDEAAVNAAKVVNARHEAATNADKVVVARDEAALNAAKVVNARSEAATNADKVVVYARDVLDFEARGEPATVSFDRTSTFSLYPSRGCVLSSRYV